MSAPMMDPCSLAPWIEFRATRSPGPGGQNVNKVNTRVTLLFEFAECPLLTAAQKEQIRRRLATRLSADGRLRVTSSRERTQARNRAAAEARLVELLAEATRRPRARRPTRPTAASRRRRLEDKRRRGEIKQERRARPTAED
jgi:ribosome-associated protein